MPVDSAPALAVNKQATGWFDYMLLLLLSLLFSAGARRVLALRQTGL